jgi:tetratricopeptide (TPR) repeat protein
LGIFVIAQNKIPYQSTLGMELKSEPQQCGHLQLDIIGVQRGNCSMHNWQTGIVAILVAGAMAPAASGETDAKNGKDGTGRMPTAAKVPGAANDFHSAEGLKKYIQKYDVKLHTNPRDFASLYYRGLCYSKLEETKKAIADWNRSLSVNPYKEGMPEKQVLKNHLQRAELYWAFCYQNLGYQYFKQGKFREGIDDTSKAIAVTPDYPMNYQNRALAYKRLGKMDLAEKDLAKLQKLLGQTGHRRTIVFPFDRPD